MVPPCNSGTDTPAGIIQDTGSKAGTQAALSTVVTIAVTTTDTVANAIAATEVQEVRSVTGIAFLGVAE